MRDIKPPVLFELHADGGMPWTCATWPSARIANAKVELNHRSQVCEALTGTGVRVAKMVEHQGSAPCIPVWKTDRVSLNTYARWNPVLESHQPLWFCKPPPELLGQRDVKSNWGDQPDSHRHKRLHGA